MLEEEFLRKILGIYTELVEEEVILAYTGTLE
jgi:hypothetical protein